MAEPVPPSIDGGQAPTDPLSAAEVAREANAAIYELTQRLNASSVLDERAVGFLCECGCFRITTTTLAEYEKDGAWIEGHTAR